MTTKNLKQRYKESNKNGTNHRNNRKILNKKAQKIERWMIQRKP